MKSLTLLGTLLLVALAATPMAARAADDEETVQQERITRANRLRLQYHPIAPVIPKSSLRFSTLIPMHPSGFRADEFNQYLSPVYGLGDGWEISASATGAERIGRGGEAIFGGLGVQKQLWKERGGRPGLSIGGYGMRGPHNHTSGNLYLVASKRVWSSDSRKQSLFLHGGLKGEFFTSDDYKDDGGVRPFFGVNYTLSPRFFISAEVAPKQAWERDDMWALQGTFLVRLRKNLVGVSGGIRNNGYETHPFVGLVF